MLRDKEAINEVLKEVGGKDVAQAHTASTAKVQKGKELAAEMPMAVKRQMPDYDPSQEISLKSNFGTSAELSLSETPKQVTIQTIAPLLN